MMSRGPSLLMGNYNILYMHLYNNNKKIKIYITCTRCTLKKPTKPGSDSQKTIGSGSFFFTTYLMVIQSIYNNDSFCINGQAIFHCGNIKKSTVYMPRPIFCRSIFVTIQTHLYNITRVIYLYGYIMIDRKFPKIDKPQKKKKLHTT